MFLLVTLGLLLLPAYSSITAHILILCIVGWGVPPMVAWAVLGLFSKFNIVDDMDDTNDLTVSTAWYNGVFVGFALTAAYGYVGFQIKPIYDVGVQDSYITDIPVN